MNVVADISQRIPAKHILFLMDACYSGLAFARSAPISSQMPDYLNNITSARARQIITAGGAGEHHCHERCRISHRRQADADRSPSSSRPVSSRRTSTSR